MSKPVKICLTLCVLLAAAVLLPGAFRPAQKAAAGELPAFSSYAALTAYVRKNTDLMRQFGAWPFGDTGASPASGAPAGRVQMENGAAPKAAPATHAQENSVDFSGTNVQVPGVDEGDLVKSDGRYLYVISGQKVVIAAVYPPGQARVCTEIKCDGQPAELFIDGDKLAVLGNGPEHNQAFVRVYDVSNREKPVLKKDVTCRGGYVTSRLTGNYVYVIFHAPVLVPGKPGGPAEKTTLPQLTIDGHTKTIDPSGIYYFNYPDYAYQYTVILSVNTQNQSVQSKTFLTGTSQNIYASPANIYLTANKAPDFYALTDKFLNKLAATAPAAIRDKIRRIKNSGAGPGQKMEQAETALTDYLNSLNEPDAAVWEEKLGAVYRDWQTDLARERDKTVIHKLAVDGGQITYQCRGEVPGQVLNQFSMDENKGFFRIATTTQGFLFNGRPAARNNIYVLDRDLQITGRLEGLAPGERIYAARFMGDRAYLVTFRNMDPLFAIDLRDPHQPRLLGKLKIPGYSNYLQPYDETHLIGTGREVDTVPPPMPPVRPLEKPAILPPVRPGGIKIALFDVSNPAAPKEMSNYVITGPNVNSPALQDHKAVLFDRSRHLLVIPVSFQPVYWFNGAPDVQGAPGVQSAPAAPPPERTKTLYHLAEQPVTSTPPASIRSPYPLPHNGWQGAYVFNVSPEQGIRLKGKIAHSTGANSPNGVNSPVMRALYIQNVLYTVSGRLILMNDLDSLKEINRLSY